MSRFGAWLKERRSRKAGRGEEGTERASQITSQMLTKTISDMDSAGEASRQNGELEAANLQGMGSRTEQQDAFALSKLDQYEEQGILAVLCDGMGGMAEGGRIARQTVAEILSVFPWEEDSVIQEKIREISQSVYRQFCGHGGATLVAALLRENQLSFWCVGDSDLFLLRDGNLYALNIRQEFRNELFLMALEGAFPPEKAYEDPQAGALSEYIGKETLQIDATRKPFLLKSGDTLLLCSDGVSDTLTLKQIREAMEEDPFSCCSRLEKEILEAAKPNQDNYTAIVLKYHGKWKNEEQETENNEGEVGVKR